MGKQDQYNEALKEFVVSQLLASPEELIDLLVKKFGVKTVYARKIIGRAADAGIIESSDPYTFGKNGYVYFQPRKKIDFNRLKQVCQKRRPPLFRLMSRLDHSVCISYYEAQKIIGATHEKSSTKISSVNDMLNILYKLNFAHKKEDEKGNTFIFRKKHRGNLTPYQEEQHMLNEFQLMEAESILMPSILRWLGTTNLIDQTKTVFRSYTKPLKGSYHNNLVWDAYSYTNTTGFKQNNAKDSNNELLDEQTFVAIDISISKAYSQLQLDGFIARLQIHINSTSNRTPRKVIPIIVFNDIEDEALNKARAFGCITCNVKMLFGSHFREIFSTIQAIKKDHGDSIDTIEKGLASIKASGNDERLKDIKGFLFEYLMYPLIDRLFSKSKISMGKTLEAEIKAEIKKREFDFIVEMSNPDEIILIEVKGYEAHATISAGDSKEKNTLRYFFRGSVPVAQQYYANRGYTQPIRAVFITSCKFDEEGNTVLKDIEKSMLKPREMNAGYDRNAVLKLLTEYGFTRQRNIIEKYY